nr:hypothetical protein GZ27B6_21 [uncultured archaeon GZfos27B6]
MGYEPVLLAVAEAVIFFLLYKTPNLGIKYATAITGYTALLLTVSYLVTQGYIFQKSIFPLTIIGVIAILAIYLAANKKILRINEIIQILGSIGIVLAIIMPILLALFTA